MLKLYNSLTRKKEEFSSLKPKEVSLYVCGITPYDTTHLGHAFTYISFDVLVRFLQDLKYKVNYTQNITDINDRDNDLLKRAREKNMSWQDLSDLWTKRFLSDMETLNWVKPTNYLKASENIDQMIMLINQLTNNKLTYKVNGNIYLDISKVKNFGHLSGLSKTQMRKKAKEFEEGVEDFGKKNVLDIRLWRESLKSDPEHIPSFDSPFGRGRPGWHLECSAMAISTLGEQIDIHGGGIDLAYPHHESEIAQSEAATGKTPFARYWMHTAAVSYKGEKMSKSLGNLVLVSELLRNYSPDVIRWHLISHHYRKPWEFDGKEIEKSQEEFSQIAKFLQSDVTKETKKDTSFEESFTSALEDDLNTPLALEIIKNIADKKGSGKIISDYLSILGFTS